MLCCMELVLKFYSHSHLLCSEQNAVCSGFVLVLMLIHVLFLVLILMLMLLVMLM